MYWGELLGRMKNVQDKEDGLMGEGEKGDQVYGPKL